MGLYFQRFSFDNGMSFNDYFLLFLRVQSHEPRLEKEAQFTS